jgi:histidine ammonia-lyase
LTSAGRIINNEINSVSDNPLVMDNGEVISSGHFHGESVAQAMDMVAISMSEFGAISERRIHYFMKGVDGTLPPFMSMNPGLESGYMIAHVTASSLASENKTLSHPASVDSLPTSGGQEDQVSMAPWAGQKALQIQNNVATILAIELIVGLAAIKQIHKNLKPSIVTSSVYDLLKDEIHVDKGDRTLSQEIERVKNRILNGDVLKAINPICKLESF